MAAERQHRLDDRALKNLLEDLTRPESEAEIPGKATLAAQIDQLAVILRHRAAVATKANGRAGRSHPGQRALVGEMLTAAPKLDFSDCQAMALRDVLSRLGTNRELQQGALAAADPQVAKRVAPRMPHAEATPAGQAMWGAANHRAVTLYRRATATGIGAPETAPVAEAIRRIGTGQPLPEDLRRKLEAALGVSLEGVRLHIGPTAGAAAEAVNAEAFTVCEDIFMPTFEPTSSRWLETLAHEVVHCVQWRQGRISAGGGGVSRREDPLELEAETAAKSIVARAFQAPVLAAAHRRAPISDTPRPTLAALGQTPLFTTAPRAPGVQMVMRQAKSSYGGDGANDAFAWRVEDRFKDLGQSIEQAPPHIRAIGGEYAELLADNWEWIAAGFGVALGSAAIAHLYPPFAIANRVIQILLRAAGIFGLGYSAVKSVEDFKAHIRKWAITGWKALGKPEEIKKASEELARAVISLLAAAAALLGMFAGALWNLFKGNFSKAPKSSTTRPIKEINPRPQLGGSNGSAGVPALRSDASVESTSGQPAATSKQSFPATRPLLKPNDDMSGYPAMAGGAPSEKDRQRWQSEELDSSIDQSISVAFRTYQGSHYLVGASPRDAWVKTAADLRKSPLILDQTINGLLSGVSLTPSEPQAGEKTSLANKLKDLRRQMGWDLESATGNPSETLRRLRDQVAQDSALDDYVGRINDQIPSALRFKQGTSDDFISQTLANCREQMRVSLVLEAARHYYARTELAKRSKAGPEGRKAPTQRNKSGAKPELPQASGVTDITKAVEAWTKTREWADDLTPAQLAKELLALQNQQFAWMDEGEVSIRPYFRDIPELAANVPPTLQAGQRTDIDDVLGNIYIYKTDTQSDLKFVLDRIEFQHGYNESTATIALDRMRVWNLFRSLKERLVKSPEERTEILGALENAEYKPPPIAGGAPESGESMPVEKSLVPSGEGNVATPKPFQTIDDVKGYLASERARLIDISDNELRRQAVNCVDALVQGRPNLPGLTPELTKSMRTENDLLADIQKGGNLLQTVINDLRFPLMSDIGIKIEIENRNSGIRIRGTAWMTFEELKRRF